MARGTRRRPGRLGGDARRDGRRRPRDARGERRHGAAPPGGLVAEPGAHSVDGAGEGGEAGEDGEAGDSPASPASPASSPSFPADVSAGGALARELRAAADAAGGARASPVVDRTCSPSRRRGARSRRRRTNAPPGAAGKPRVRPRGRPRGKPRGRPRSRPVRAPTHRNWNRTRVARGRRARVLARVRRVDQLRA